MSGAFEQQAQVALPETCLCIWFDVIPDIGFAQLAGFGAAALRSSAAPWLQP